MKEVPKFIINTVINTCEVKKAVVCGKTFNENPNRKP
jgi:hypothetical protein